MSDQLELWPEEAPGERLSWSWSRDRRLRECARKYFLHHYASRGGWQPEAPAPVRQAYVLRHLQSRHMWVGTVVHELIELALGAMRRGETVPVDGLVERGIRRMRAQYAESMQGLYWERPLQACGLVEHEYGENIAREEWQAQRDRMERCVRAFFALPLVEAVQKKPLRSWLAIEALGSFDLDGATIVVRPDLAWREGQGVFIADWKTGMVRPEEERLQLATYGLYARRAWGVRDEGITAVIVHLDTSEGGATVSEHHVGGAEFAATEQFIRDSVAAMRALVDSGEPDPARFPMTENRERCPRCVFRRLCRREDPARFAP